MLKKKIITNLIIANLIIHFFIYARKIPSSS